MATPTKRALFIAGKLAPRRREPRPCSNGWHVGPHVDTERFTLAGGIWEGTGLCLACGSHVHKDQIRARAS